MIYGTLQQWNGQKIWFPASFSAALAFASRPDLDGLEDGRYPIEGEDIFALLQRPETEPEALRRFELHREYIDIQLLLSGSEKQLYAPQPRGETGLPPQRPLPQLLEDRLHDLDYAFYARPPHYNAVLLRPGDFTIYLPGELHCPNCAPDSERPGRIRKIVFKIRK